MYIHICINFETKVVRWSILRAMAPFWYALTPLLLVAAGIPVTVLGDMVYSPDSGWTQGINYTP